MPVTTKYRCANCDFIAIVEAETSLETAMQMAMDHLNENRDHEIPSPRAVWTNNPYIEPTINETTE